MLAKNFKKKEKEKTLAPQSNINSALEKAEPLKKRKKDRNEQRVIQMLARLGHSPTVTLTITVT